jgi:hypothetical protein
MLAKFGPAVRDRLSDIKAQSADYYTKVAEHLINKHIPDFTQITKMWQEGQEGAKWYEGTFEDLSRIFGKEDAEKLINFLAITSAHVKVETDAKLGLKALSQYKAGLPFEGFVGAQRKNLQRYVETGEFSGQKTTQFAKALMGDPNAVVIDIWMMRLFGFDHDNPTEDDYEFVSNIITAEANKLGVPPAELQAALWTAYKKSVGDTRTVKPLKDVFKDAMKIMIQQGKVTPGQLGVEEEKAKETGVMPETQQLTMNLAAGLIVKMSRRV